LHAALQNGCVIFNKLVINSIENSSGIFIGTNYAAGWSTYSKQNQGFGSIKDTTVSHTFNVVNDRDVIDMPINDSKQITEAPAGDAGVQNVVSFQSINANNVSNVAVIDVGENRQPGWNSYHKNNYGTGKSIGINRLFRIANHIQDNDVIDAPSYSKSWNPG
jgi:hypothetical protein